MKVDEYFKKVDEIPFDFNAEKDVGDFAETHNGKHLLICKGAVEEMLDVCTFAFEPGENRQLHIENDKVVPMDDKDATRAILNIQED